ncbi:hypothetical protein [Bosea sp. (in: a-proteobacteria)]|uniref:hypothetical protein n=1 Tax=Bosea sp. (in: a-proteobacteria) TaxID=1871050 RepID=UPI0026287E6E|nr:hypothetical protein [Bosea sp. (in: a-proteobacteria)]MCO5091592.1 hypothetical protein [Bosea sp. (in: a-proteobacteria)]
MSPEAMPSERPIGIGHNGGPPLKPRKRRQATGSGAIGRYFDWRFAHRRAWKKPRDIALRREENAAKLGLTYEEYALEIMERGYFPQAEHVEAIKAQRARRRKDGGVVGQSLKGMRLS